MENLKALELTELNKDELECNNGGLVWKPFVVAGYLAYITYNELVDLKNDFIEGYNEYRNP